MSFLTRYAMDVLLKTPHPEIDRRLCWNLVPQKEKCTDCQQICPHGSEIFTRPNLPKDWAACIDCGLCSAVCRSRCIAPSAEQIERDLAPLDNRSDTIWIGCEQSARQNDLVRRCICALSWEALAYLALNRKLVLDLTPCGECENDLCAQKLRATLTRLVEFFGGRLFDARFTLAYQPEDAPYQVKNISRREMFSQVTDSSKAGTKHLLRMLPALQDDSENRALSYRILLNQRIKQLRAATETPVKYGYYLPVVNQKCYGCGKCEKSCKAQALRMEPLENNQMRMVITPWKCSECGQCVRTCSAKAIDGLALRQVAGLGPVSVHKLTITPCSECGKPVPPDCKDGLCAACRVKARTRHRQQLAAERRRKQQEAAAAKAAGTAPAETAAPAAPATPPADPHAAL